MSLLRLIAFVFLSFIGQCAGAYAQDPYSINIGKSAGFPSNAIYSILQDSKGFIWVGHEEGISRYDGHEIKTYTHPQQTSKACSELKEDKYGRIWYENFDGYIYYIQNGTPYALAQHTPIGYRNFSIAGNSLVVAQNLGLDVFNLKTLTYQHTIQFDIVKYGSATSDDSYYYTRKDDTLAIISIQSGSIKKIKTGIDVGTLKIAQGKLLGLATEGYEKSVLYELVNNVWQKKFQTKDLGYIQSIAGIDNTYWYCTTHGIWPIDENGGNLANINKLFADKNITCITKDDEGNFWLGTLDEGILFIPDLNTSLISIPGFVPNKLYNTGNDLLIGTKNNSVYTYTPGIGLMLRLRDSISHQVNALSYDTFNKRYLVAALSLKIFDKNFKQVDIITGAIKSVCPIDDKYYAVAITGLCGIHNNNVNKTSIWDSIFTQTKSIYNNNIAEFVSNCRARSVAYNAARHTIYFATNKGLYTASPHSITELKYKSNTIYSTETALHNNAVFVLTGQNTILLADSTGKVTNIAVKGNNVIIYKLRKVSDAIYALTNYGLQRYNALTNSFIPTNLLAGINSGEINDLEALGDKIIVATDKGLIITSGFPAQGKLPRFIINEYVVHGKRYSSISNHSFLYFEKDIEIQYSVLHYKTQGQYPLYYKINDGSWQSTDKETHNLKLASLSPGVYTISFRLGSEDDKIPATHITFTIRKPLWQEWWFLAICAFILASAGYAYNRQRIKQLKKKSAFITEKMELEKNLRASMLTAIRSQMNPHFFYNALNTIQSFIFSDDKRNAATYLVKFSKLTRTILDMSGKDTVALTEEIEALTLYLELEKIRFDDTFNYTIIISPEVETQSLQIPSMIIQPYVENAIKHGLLHKAGAKNISVEFIRINGNLCITIEDNGIGRKRAGELNILRKEKHTSFSTEANNKRIELLNKERAKKIQVVFIDKEDEYGEPMGTTVIISVPGNFL